jgi:hypothetical protein
MTGIVIYEGRGSTLHKFDTRNIYELLAFQNRTGLFFL